MSADDHEGKADAMLAFAQLLLEQVSSPTSATAGIFPSEETLSTLNNYTTQAPLFKAPPPVSRRCHLDVAGVKLWNACVQALPAALSRSTSEWICKAKVFAFGMLDGASPNKTSGFPRTIEVALKTVKSCIAIGLYDLSQQLVEIAAIRLDAMDRSDAKPDQFKIDALFTRYYMLRIYLAWHQGRPDIADHLYGQVLHVETDDDRAIVTEVCYKVAELALSGLQYDLAAKWSQRALRICSNGLQRPNVDGAVLGKPLILHQLVRANLHLEDASSRESLQVALDSLEVNKITFPVLVLRLEVLRRQVHPDWHEYFQLLLSAIETMKLHDSIIRMILFYIHKLKVPSVVFFLDSLQKLLIDRLGISDGREWTEHVLISIIWSLSSCGLSTEDCLDRLSDSFGKLKELGWGNMSERASHASLIVIWKYIDMAISRGDYPRAEKWCLFALQQQQLLIRPANQAKLVRKTLICALNSHSSSDAYRSFDESSEELKSCPSTLYLMYSLALQDKDSSSYAYLDLLSNLEKGGSLYLTSCAALALEKGETPAAMAAFRRMIKSYPDGVFPISQAASLIQVIKSEIEKCKADVGDLLSHAVFFMDTVFQQACREDCKFDSPIDIPWFSQSSYDMALKGYKSVATEITMSLLDLSAQFAELWEKDPSTDNSVLHEHYLVCDFLRAIHGITAARKEKNLPEKIQKYIKVLQSTQRFRKHVWRKLGPCNIASEQDELPQKHRMIISFDVEASMFLNNLDDAVHVIQESAHVIDDRLASTLLDCILRSNAPLSHLTHVVKTLLRTIHASSSPYIEPSTTQLLLPRYLHVLFNLSLNAAETDLAESVLDQAICLARSGKNTPGRYPDDEIHWLATVAFNRAVDFYIASEDGHCRRWSGKAIQLADLVDGETERGLLGRLLRQKLENLVEDMGE